MTICFASTYPPRQCGIATYTRKLITSMVEGRDEKITVLAELGGESTDPRIPCTPAFSRGTNYAEGLVKAAGDAGASVVHFQHAPDIFGMGSDLIDTLRGLRDRGVRTAITLHTVFTRRSGLLERKPFVVGFHKKLADSVDRIVVHSAGSRDILLEQGIADERMVLIPHGTDPFEVGDAASGREVMGLSNEDRAILFFGFIHVQKNIQVLIKAMPQVLEKVPLARLVIAGKVGGNAWYNRLYLGHLKRMIRGRGLQDRVSIIDSFIPDENVADIHAASRVIALPHAQGYGSASGVVHNAMTMQVPMLCSDSIKFEEVASNISPDLLVGTDDVQAWATMMVRLIKDEEFADHMKTASSAYARRTFWNIVGASHLELYDTLAKEGSA